MAKQQRTDAVWVNIDPDTLAPDLQADYKAYKDAYRTMKGMREAFETAMGASVPQGKRMIFGYNFGKLSVALVEDDRTAPKAKSQTMSLDQYMATMAAQGRAT